MWDFIDTTSKVSQTKVCSFKSQNLTVLYLNLTMACISVFLKHFEKSLHGDSNGVHLRELCAS